MATSRAPWDGQPEKPTADIFSLALRRRLTLATARTEESADAPAALLREGEGLLPSPGESNSDAGSIAGSNRASFDITYSLKRSGGGRKNKGSGKQHVNVRDHLLRTEFHKRLSAQVLLANFPPALHRFAETAVLLRTRSFDELNYLQLFVALCSLLCACQVLLVAVQRVRPRLPAWRPTAESVMLAIMVSETVVNAALSVLGFVEFHTYRENCGPHATAAACSQAYFLSFHMAAWPKWVASCFTTRFIFFPELVRNALFFVGEASLAAADGSASLSFVALLFAESVGSFLATLVVVKACRDLTFEDRHLPRLEMCPSFFWRWRELLVYRIERVTRSVLPEPILEPNAVSGLAFAGGVVFALLPPLSGHASTYNVCLFLNITFFSMLFTALISKLLGGTNTALSKLARRLGLSTEQRSLSDLSFEFSLLKTEDAVLEAGLSALRSLLPSAVAAAVSTLPCEGRDAATHASADDDGPRDALAAALEAGCGRGTSVGFVTSGSGAEVIWSSDLPGGTRSFTDWRMAEGAGLDGEAVTGRIGHGADVYGYVIAHMARHASAEMRARSEQLNALCIAVGGAIAALRLTREKAVSSALLHDIFPEHIARKLAERRHGKVEEEELARRSRAVVSDLPPPSPLLESSPRRSSSEPAFEEPRPSIELIAEAHESVTVLFADIVGFTTLSAARTPVQVMSFLNDLFSRQDQLCARLDCYKVETIGDCYMAVAGMIPRTPDHAGAAVRLALAMHTAAARVSIGNGETLCLRIGLHTGPVTAGLIGSTRARYCLFGDTVNTASRMESTGFPGCTHLSEATAELCRLPSHLLEPRVLEVKGKGAMQTYLLKAEHAAEAIAALAPEADASTEGRKAGVSPSRSRRIGGRLSQAMRVDRVFDDGAGGGGEFREDVGGDA